MNHVYRYGAVFAALVLAACGGGGGGTSPLPSITAPATGSGNGSTPTPAPASTATPGPSTSAQVSAATGGTLSIPVGSSTLTLTIPAGALSANSTVRLGLYGAGSAPKSSSVRRNDGLPSGSHVLSSFWIDLGGAHLYKQLTATLSNVSSPSGGVAIRLARYNLAVEQYFDVDTASVTNGSLLNNNANGFVGISSGSGPSDAYEFYAASSSAMSAPPLIQLHLSAAASALYTSGGTGSFVASGSDVHGNVYVFRPRFSVDNTSVGTVATSPTDQYTGIVTFGSSFTPAHLTVTDPASSATASISIALSSEHPVTGGSTFAYSGTLTQNTVRVTPTLEPVPTAVPSIPPSSISATIAQSVTVNPNQSYNGLSNLYDIATTETRSTRLQSTTSTTHAYYGFKDNTSETDFLLYGTDWADDNNNTLSYQYPAPQLIDRLPETNGDNWTNTGATNFYENDSVDSAGSAFVSTGVVANDGSYTEKVDYPEGYVVAGTAIEADIVENGSNGTGSYVAPFFGAAEDTILYSRTVNPRTSQFTITANMYGYPNALPSDTMPDQTFTLNGWYSLTQPLWSDTTVNNGPATIPQACNASASFGTSANKLVRTIDRIDFVLGYHETQTTTSYTVPGVGTVCSQMHDVLQDYYNFSFDFAYLDEMFSDQPYQTTTTDETLGLQQNGTTILPSAKRRAAVAAAGPVSFVAPSNLGFLRTVNHARVNHSRAFIQAITRKKGSTH